MVAVGKECGGYEGEYDGEHLSLVAAMTPSAAGGPEQQVKDDEEGEESKFLQIEQRREGKHFGGILANHHVEHEAVDMESVEVVDLHVEEDEHGDEHATCHEQRGSSLALLQ